MSEIFAPSGDPALLEASSYQFLTVLNLAFIQFREELINLSHHCKDASLVVTPKKGTAIFWYNHHVDANNGWLGEMDNYGLHGGCDVIRGEKWISNIWLTAPYEKDKDQRSVYDTSSD